jgi:dipeptidyl aminopeptidase/acylaminoacyl peptidase
MRRVFRYAVAGWTGLSIASAFLAENALHIGHHDEVKSSWADTIAHQLGVSWNPVQIAAEDGARLDGWLFTPPHPNGSGVILMHGVGDTRMGMTGHAPFLLRAGYTVLLPDSRGHGASGGAIITYGVRESGDVHRWADVLLRAGVDRLYGLGQSMGAAILLQALPHEPRFRALVAACPFSSFPEIAMDRLEQHDVPTRAVSWPVVTMGLAYARLRYGVNLWSASPADALRATHVPVLLIHGADDDNIRPRHSRELHAANPGATELWEVPRAGHVASIVTQPEEYERRVLAWFAGH